jgi:hypothetical protein
MIAPSWCHDDHGLSSSHRGMRCRMHQALRQSGQHGGQTQTDARHGWQQTVSAPVGMRSPVGCPPSGAQLPPEGTAGIVVWTPAAETVTAWHSPSVGMASELPPHVGALDV